MIKTVFFLLPFLFLFSCQADQNSISESERDAKIDSLVGVRMQEITRQATEDLDRRKAIEIKAKADSIVAAQVESTAHHPAPADNTIPGNVPMP